MNTEYNVGHIPEPKGIDFIIQSKELTDEERKEVSDFIAERKKQLKKVLQSRSE